MSSSPNLFGNISKRRNKASHWMNKSQDFWVRFSDSSTESFSLLPASDNTRDTFVTITLANLRDYRYSKLFHEWFPLLLHHTPVVTDNDSSIGRGNQHLGDVGDTTR